MMNISDEEMSRIFSEAMEQGGPKAPDTIAERRKAIYKAFDAYLEEVERAYFAWGYEVCLDRHPPFSLKTGKGRH